MDVSPLPPSGIPSPALAEDITLYRRIAQELPHGAVFVVDRGLRYVLAQGPELAAAGFTPLHFEGRTVREAVPPALVDQHEADYRTILDGGSFEREHEINGRHYRSYGIPLRDAEGRPQLALVTSYESTEQVLAERRKDKALAILGHELRNPLAALTMGIALLKRSRTGRPPAGAVDLMERQVRQMTSMVDDLLGMAFLAHGKLELHRECVDAVALADEVLASLQPSAARKTLALSCLHPLLPAMVDADHAKLTQVLTNLVGNAIKYTPEGGEVQVAFRHDGECVEISVADTGVGLDPEAVSRLFDLFSRGVQHGVAPWHVETGLGIGLWVAKNLVEAHGGTLVAHSPGPGAGSVFTLTIPMARSS
jgi:signal transduction histidine kinase